MSIINDALKKAQTEAKKPEPTPSQAARNLHVEFQKRKPGVNWGPIFVVLVLLLITGPIIAPVFSTPFKPGNPHLTAVNQKASAFQNVAAEPARQQLASLTAQEPAATRQAQFGIEEAIVPTPYTRPNFLVSGIVYSAQDSYCLINEKVVRVGESIQGAKLAKVTPEEVTLDFHGEKIVIPVMAA